MLPNSTLYVAFVLVTTLVYWRLPVRWRLPSLLLFGTCYYAYANPKSFFILLLLLPLTYGAALLMQQWRARARIVLIVSVTAIVLLLMLFKYSRFLNAWAPVHSSLTEELFAFGLPLGISFFTFEFIHYLCDVHAGKIERVAVLPFLTFGLFYPSVIAGPIKRYEHFAAQLPATRFAPQYLYYGLLLLLLGYAQKIMIADPLVPATTSLMHVTAAVPWWQAWMKLTLYSVRIYADFAGLSNIAIGTGLLFGIILPRNFASPYLSQSISEFWRRWHMSLSSWVRDYLYIPLGGNRGSLVRVTFRLLVVMLIMGAWHGSSLNFPVWGLYQGLGLAVHRVWQRLVGKHLPHSLFRRLLNTLVTFLFVTLGWAFFLTTSLTDSFHLLHVLFPFLPHVPLA